MPLQQQLQLQKLSPNTLLRTGLFTCQGQKPAAAAVAVVHNNHQQQQQGQARGDQSGSGAQLQQLQQQVHDYTSELQMMKQQLGLGSVWVPEPNSALAGALPQ
jgi:hypothetical protein